MFFETHFAMLHRSLAAILLALSLAAGTAAVARDDAPAPSDAPAKSAAPTPPAAKAPSASQSALRDRQKACGAEWRALTDAQKAAQGPKWPQFWSQCNKRLKGHDKA